MPARSAFAMSAAILLGFSVTTAALSQGATSADTTWTTDQPLTGHAIPCDSGRIKDFECHNVELLAYLPKGTIGGAGGVDMWGWVDSTTGREFAIVNGQATTAFVEVTDPLHPQYLGQLPGNSLDVKVYRDHAFLVDEEQGDGVRVFDLTQLRDVKHAPATFQEAARYHGVQSVHNIVLDQATGTAYAVGSHGGEKDCGPGLHMIDVRDPEHPTFAGCYSNTAEGKVAVNIPGLGTGYAGGDGYVHDAQCVIYHGPDQRYHDREICVAPSGTAVLVVDVTDRKAPKTLSVVRYPNVGYAHQGWFTEDQRYFFLDDEMDETQGTDSRTRTLVFDMSELDDPVMATQYYATTHSTDHNLYIRGHYMYQGNYGAGFRALDITDPKHPKEVGYLTNVGKAWTTYPYFKNDVVAFSTTLGLFLVRLQTR